MDHIKPLRLFDLSRIAAAWSGKPITDEEQQHLCECEECANIVVIFTRQFSKETSPNDNKQGTAA